jgi:hypothetical protein
LNGGTPELSYHAIPPPKLDVVVVNKSLCRFECCAVVSKIKNYRFHEMTVSANYVCAIVGHMTHAGSGEHYRTLCPRFCRGRGDDEKAYSGASEAVCPIADRKEISLIHPIRPFATLVFRLTGRRRLRGHQYAKAKAKLISQRPIARTPMQTPPLLMAAEDRGPLMHAHVRHDAGPARRKNQFQNTIHRKKSTGDG